MRSFSAIWSCCGSTRSSSPCARWCSPSCCASSSSTSFRRSDKASAAAAIPGAESAFATVLVPGVVGSVHHVPGHPGRRHADGAGVRLHPRDRGQGAGALSHLARGHLQGDLRRAPRACFRRHRPPHRLGGPRRGRGGPHQSALAPHPDARPHVVRVHGVARAAPRDFVRAPQPRAHVRLHRAADHVSRRHLLPVDPAGARARPARSTGCRSSCWSTRSSTSTTGCAPP